MIKTVKFVLAATAVATLVACGGGDGTTVSTENNPLKKYEGTYYICDGHTKETVTVTATGSNAVNLTNVEEIYNNTNCSGSVVGTFRLPQPVTATYLNQTTANFPPVTILPNADTVDRVNLSSPAMTAQLTGTGVSGSCVTYTGGNVCYNNINLSALNETGAAYLSGNYLITFNLVNGVLEAEGIYSKDATFNFNMLVAD